MNVIIRGVLSAYSGNLRDGVGSVVKCAAIDTKIIFSSAANVMYECVRNADEIGFRKRLI